MPFGAFKPVDGSEVRRSQPAPAAGGSGLTRSASDNETDAAARNMCKRWMNSKLKEAGYDQLEKLVDGFTDGIAIAKVLEMLSGERVRVKKNARLAAIKLDNLKKVFDCIDQIDVLDEKDNFAAKDFFDGNEKMIVAFCFKLILKYDMPRSAKMLLKWMKKRINPFGYDLDIDEPVPHVASGKEFMALINSQRPDWCDAANLEDKDPVEYLTQAFEYLETEFGVPQLLEPEDVGKAAISDMELVVYLQKVKDAFDAEQPDVEPESLEYPGAPFEFTVDVEIPSTEGVADSPLLPVTEPEGELENLAYSIEPALPAGLEMDPVTGVIKGTATAAAVGITYTVTASNSAGEVTCEIGVDVKDIEPTGIAYDGNEFSAVVGGNVAISSAAIEPECSNLVFTISPALPPGLEIDETNGCIYGNPTDDAVGEQVYTVTAANTGGSTSTDIVLKITDVPPATLAYEEQTLTVGVTCMVVGVLQPTEASHVEYTVDPAPGALVFDEKAGTFSGAPAQADVGTVVFQVTATNSGGSVNGECKITVKEVCPTGIIFDNDARCVAIYGLGVTEGGHPPSIEPAGTPVLFTVEPALPEGMILDETTGAISGVPCGGAKPSEEGYTVTITAANSGGTCAADVVVVILEVPPSEVTYPDGPVLQAPMDSDLSFSPEIKYAQETNGEFKPDVKFTVEPALPQGLVLNEDTGVISGVVTNPELYLQVSQHTVTCQNSGGSCETKIQLEIHDDAREFFDMVDKNQKDYVSNLKDLVSMPSISCQDDCREQIQNCKQWYSEKAEKLGGTVKLVPVRYGTDGNNDVLEITFGNDPEKKTVCAYGHLDVQPVEGMNWATDPFVMSEAQEKMFGRGTSASKGPAVSWLWVVDAYQKLGRPLPVNLKIMMEGMKEVGSTGLEALVLEEAKPGGFLSDVDYFCISANSWLGRRTPCVTYGLRGLCHFTAEVVMGSKDLHSGVFGGTVHEAMTDVAMLMTKLVDPNGKMLIPGIYDATDDVVTEAESAAYDKMDFDLDEYAEDLGLSSKDSLVYKTKQDTLMHRWRYPCLSLHGIEGVFSDPGQKTVIPHRAVLKFSIRLVPGMEPAEVDAATQTYLQECFAALGSGNRLALAMTQGCKAWVEDFNTPHYDAAKNASKKVHGIEPDLTREGDTVPITVTIAEATGKSVCMLPIGASDDNTASANEKLNLSNYTNGIKTMGLYLEEVAKI